MDNINPRPILKELFLAFKELPPGLVKIVVGTDTIYSYYIDIDNGKYLIEEFHEGDNGEDIVEQLPEVNDVNGFFKLLKKQSITRIDLETGPMFLMNSSVNIFSCQHDGCYDIRNKNIKHELKNSNLVLNQEGFGRKNHFGQFIMDNINPRSMLKHLFSAFKDLPQHKVKIVVTTNNNDGLTITEYAILINDGIFSVQKVNINRNRNRNVVSNEDVDDVNKFFSLIGKDETIIKIDINRVRTSPTNFASITVYDCDGGNCYETKRLGIKRGLKSSELVAKITGHPEFLKQAGYFKQLDFGRRSGFGNVKEPQTCGYGRRRRKFGGLIGNINTASKLIKKHGDTLVKNINKGKEAYKKGKEAVENLKDASKEAYSNVATAVCPNGERFDATLRKCVKINSFGNNLGATNSNFDTFYKNGTANSIGLKTGCLSQFYNAPVSRFGKKRFIQEAMERSRRKGTVGSFKRWCKRQGYSKVTPACINRGKKSKNLTTRRRAIFAQNIRPKKRSDFGDCGCKRPLVQFGKLKARVNSDISYLVKLK